MRSQDEKPKIFLYENFFPSFWPYPPVKSHSFANNFHVANFPWSICYLDSRSERRGEMRIAEGMKEINDNLKKKQWKWIKGENVWCERKWKGEISSHLPWPQAIAINLIKSCGFLAVCWKWDYYLRWNVLVRLSRHEVIHWESIIKFIKSKLNFASHSLAHI